MVFFNYGVDKGTVFKSAGFHNPFLWRHVSWRRKAPNGQGRESRYGWLYYRRVKTGKQFQLLCRLAGVKPKQDVESGADTLWVLKDLRRICATYYEAHMPESSIEILGHSVGGVSYRHYAHRDPLAFKAILSLTQPTAFKALRQGFEGECPCCRRKFHQT